MHTKELTFKGEDQTVLYACGECGRLSSPAIYMAKPDVQHATARRMAEECCAPRKCECGAEIEKHWTACSACRERKMLNKATLIDMATHDGPVSAESEGDWGDGYSSSIEAMIEACHEHGEPVPAYCHPCHEQHLRLDPDSLLENAVDGMHEDAGDQIEAADELSDFIAGWNAKQRCVSYYADRSRVIVIDQKRFDDLLLKPTEDPAV